jgi:hypothetical protein
MKRVVLAIVCLLVLTGTSFAQHIGPGTPVKNKDGNIATPNVGIGYSYYNSKWDDFDIEQNQTYLHVGAVFGDLSTPNYEAYLRIGASDLKEEDDDFDADFEPFYGAGLRCEFVQGRIWGLGGVFQAAYMYKFTDKVTGIVNGVNLDDKVNVKNMVQLDAAAPIQVKLRDSLLYFGPLVYYSTAKVKIDSLDYSDRFDEDYNFGGYAGVAFRFQNVSIEIESEYRSDFSGSALVSFTF